MSTKDREAYFWRAEYESLRRKKEKEIKQLHVSFHNHVIKTWKLLKLLGMKEEEIIEFYEKNWLD